MNERLRYEPGEQRAREMWAEATARLGVGLGMGESEETARLSMADAISTECVEVVALGCVVPGVPGLVWVELENSADEPWKAFDVSDEEMRRAVQYIVATYGPQARAHVLWHSHYVHNEPSGTDISSFPEWLVGVGVVYHAPTETSHAYDQSGSLISTSHNPSLAR